MAVIELQRRKREYYKQSTPPAEAPRSPRFHASVVAMTNLTKKEMERAVADLKAYMTLPILVRRPTPWSLVKPF
jgi:hypothetical protein